ncbi:MAG TPA: sialidase family protein, partial [Candidatus Thermoplasmatota archaeon]|nr:sialidase family protein [Candidatus Thermoplasmatota archaeon]
MRISVLLLAGLLAGCLSQSTPEPASLDAPLHAMPALAFSAPVRIDAEQPAREPAIVQAKDGALYVAGFWGFARHVEYPGTAQNLAQGPLVWKSTDLGATWQRLEPGTALDGAVSNSDLDLAVDDTGMLYLAALSYYSAPLPPGVAAPTLPVDAARTLSVVVGASEDGGAHWRWSLLDRGRGMSHPWVAVQPSGTAHVVWADEDGVRAASSNSRGQEWVQRGLVHPQGEAGGIAASLDGALAVRIAPIGPNPADGVAVSRDGGASWDFRAAPGNRSGPEPRGFDNVAFDAAGVLYMAWNEGRAVRLARSADLGAFWADVTIVEEPEGSLPYDPSLRAGGPGHLGMTWFTATGDVVAARVAHVAFDGLEPRTQAGTFMADTGGINHADYYQLAFLQDG